jgi:hypothetical protein
MVGLDEAGRPCPTASVYARTLHQAPAGSVNFCCTCAFDSGRITSGEWARSYTI